MCEGKNRQTQTDNNIEQMYRAENHIRQINAFMHIIFRYSPLSLFVHERTVVH
jgi:hypothetical protein